MLPIVCLAALLGTGPPSQPPLVVSAAISLTDALREIEKAYTAAGGGPVRFNLAGSNVLARQIVNGAPADVFISADEAQMDFAQATGAIDKTTRVDLLTNRLAIVTFRGKASPVVDTQSLVRARRIAIGDPSAVPAGVYARQFLERSGLWQKVQDRLISLANVRSALSAVESGGADVAIVYASDAAASKKVDLAYVVTGADAPRIVYPAAALARTTSRDAAVKFLAFLRGPEATAIFRRYRFSIPPGPAEPQ